MAENRALFFFDYVDAESWIVELWLDELWPFDGITLDRRSYELRPPPEVFLGPGDPDWESLRSRALPVLEAMGRTLASPSLVPWTRKAHELALHAARKGCYEHVHASLFETFHEDGADIGRIDVLVSIAVSAGLDASESKAVLDVDRYADEVCEARREAERLGVKVTPTLLVGHKRLERPRGFDELRTFLASRGEAS
ncbi:MAG: hypothetical protein BMS9Abin29_0255 [Gemmatimonadota bacterium]|nr:MAG: hypothetical protein BMS9Abin29_0255 [Gemmatimonadota bacterium]